MAVLAPIPTARVKTAMAVKPGWRDSVRAAKRRSCRIVCIDSPQALDEAAPGIVEKFSSRPSECAREGCYNYVQVLLSAIGGDFMKKPVSRRRFINTMATGASEAAVLTLPI